MSKKLSVGNLSFKTTEVELRALFTPYGEVSSADLIVDRGTGRSRGFGFVVMEDDAAALRAIEAVNGSECGGRTLTVNEARPREGSGASRGGFRRRS